MKRNCIEIPIKRIIENIDQGKFAVPKLQRNYVWDKGKIKSLIDSILRDLPVGTITIWKTDKKNKDMIKQSHDFLPQYLESNDEIWFILDGQQRLATLYSLTQGEERTSKPKKKEIKINFSKFVIDLRNYKHNQSNSSIKYQIENLENDITSFHHILKSYNCGLDSKKKMALKRAKLIRQTFKYYNIPCLFIKTNERDEVVESFVRINRAGKTLDKADAVIARACEFDIRNLIEGTQTKINKNHPSYGRLDTNIFLHGLSFLEGNKSFGSKTLDAWVNRKEKEISEHPPENMLLPIAVYFYINNIVKPKNIHKEIIRKWFWLASFSARYSGKGYYTNFLVDLTRFKNLGNGSGTKGFRGEIKRGLLRDQSYGKKSAISSGLFLMLINKKPRSLTDGERIPTVDIVSRDNRKNLHHIYPYSTLRNRGIKVEERNDYANLCIQSENDNIRISNDMPVRYLNEHIVDMRSRKAALSSNLIPEEYIYLEKKLKKEFKIFLATRWALFEKNICSLTGKSLKISTE